LELYYKTIYLAYLGIQQAALGTSTSLSLELSALYLWYLAVTTLTMLRTSGRGLLACIVAALLATTEASVLPSVFRDFTPRATKLTAEQVGKELIPTLSSTASVYTTGNNKWANATARWNSWAEAMPNVQLVIEPGSEADVAKIVSINPLNGPWACEALETNILKG
jgi:hypothetical protein